MEFYIKKLLHEYMWVRNQLYSLGWEMLGILQEKPVTSLDPI